MKLWESGELKGERGKQPSATLWWQLSEGVEGAHVGHQVQLQGGPALQTHCGLSGIVPKPELRDSRQAWLVLSPAFQHSSASFLTCLVTIMLVCVPKARSGPSTFEPMSNFPLVSQPVGTMALPKLLDPIILDFPICWMTSLINQPTFNCELSQINLIILLQFNY